MPPPPVWKPLSAQYAALLMPGKRRRRVEELEALRATPRPIAPCRLSPEQVDGGADRGETYSGNRVLPRGGAGLRRGLDADERGSSAAPRLGSGATATSTPGTVRRVIATARSARRPQVLPPAARAHVPP